MSRLFTARELSRLNRAWMSLETARQTGAEFDPMPVVKWFTPDAGATWLVAAVDPSQRIAFGVCDLGLGFVEIGEIDMSELRALRGRLGLPVERDRWFRPDKPLSGYRCGGHIIGRLVT